MVSPPNDRDATDATSSPASVRATAENENTRQASALPYLALGGGAAFLIALMWMPLLISGSDEAGSGVVADVPGDDGTALRVDVAVAIDAFAKEAPAGQDEQRRALADEVVVYAGAGEDGLLTEAARQKLVESDAELEPLLVKGLTPGRSVTVRTVVLDADEQELSSIDRIATPLRNLFSTDRRWVFAILVTLCGTILAWIIAARRGNAIWVRHIPALDAVDEAVGRATEMGKPCLFVPGIQDLNEIQTIAGLTVLGHVANRTADYRSDLEVPTSRSLVMTAARETVEASYLQMGRADSYMPDTISYITDEQFGYVAYLSGWMVREEPAACFYLGAFYAESLILAETGNAIGAVQMAGTAEPSQLPFFVAACDYTLIGEEFFAASAYLSGDPDQLGSLRGQDTVKLFAMAMIGLGVLLATLGGFGAIPEGTADFLTDVVLGSG